MTGLNPVADRIIEIACLVTDAQLNQVAQGPSMVIHQQNDVLGSMDEWNLNHHTDSGLIERVRKSTITERMAQKRILEFLHPHVPSRIAPLCGNSIWQDRRFLAKYMPDLEKYLHYRNIDVSSVKELVKRWYPSLPAFKKQKLHTALSDIRESILELQYYREHVLVEEFIHSPTVDS